MIYKERIRQAREINGLTQAQLAAAVGVNQSAIAHFETGRAFPSVAIAESIASETGVRPRFFERRPLAPLSASSLAYRSRSSVRGVERDQAHQYVALLIEQMKQMSVESDLPRIGLPKPIENPATSARMTRMAFGLDPMLPVSHVINTMEQNGAVVLRLPITLEKIDAFSTWLEIDCERPIVALSSVSAGDRLRFSTAHELGHLVMHKGAHRNANDLESEANRFAAEFLLPERAMRECLTQSLNLTVAARLKRRWRVSIQVIVRRAKDLEIISPRRYRYLFEQLAIRGWRIVEPGEVPVERPRLYRRMAEHLYGHDSVNQMSQTFDISASLVKALLDEFDPFDPRVDVSMLDETEPYQYDGPQFYN